MKHLYLLRGLPGSGKTTLAKELGGDWVEADMFFMEGGKYYFDGSKLKLAHQWCQDQVQEGMVNGRNKIVVSNTFTQEWEMAPYYEMAKEYDYTVFSIVVENRHGGVNEHGVPDDALDRMEGRFELKLR